MFWNKQLLNCIIFIFYCDIPLNNVHGTKKAYHHKIYTYVKLLLAVSYHSKQHIFLVDLICMKLDELTIRNRLTLSVEPMHCYHFLELGLIQWIQIWTSGNIFSRFSVQNKNIQVSFFNHMHCNLGCPVQCFPARMYGWKKGNVLFVSCKQTMKTFHSCSRGNVNFLCFNFVCCIDLGSSLHTCTTLMFHFQKSNR